jgi:hypothetical protein
MQLSPLRPPYGRASTATAASPARSSRSWAALPPPLTRRFTSPTHCCEGRLSPGCTPPQLSWLGHVRRIAIGCSRRWCSRSRGCWRWPLPRPPTSFLRRLRRSRCRHRQRLLRLRERRPPADDRIRQPEPGRPRKRVPGTAHGLQPGQTAPPAAFRHCPYSGASRCARECRRKPGSSGRAIERQQQDDGVVDDLVAVRRELDA